mmetsp:Transcript_12540/g.16064  ORF Transcript_12540/g.16064 Transcript_12540/m.16064 type:complete len:236 (+) Transcript_12540:879-1586(+)
MVVKEDAAEATGLAAMLDGEVLVSPLLEFGVIFWVMLVADVLVCLVEVLDVFLKEVSRGDVRAAAKPPDAAIRLEVTVIEVHGGCHRVTRVHHTGKAACKEGDTLALLVALGTVCASRGSRLEGILGHRAVHDRERAASLLKDVTVAQHTRDAAATARTSPDVLSEGLAIKLAHSIADGVLSPTAILLELAAHLHVGIREVIVADERLRSLIDILMRVPADARRLLLVGSGRLSE